MIKEFQQHNGMEFEYNARGAQVVQIRQLFDVLVGTYRIG